MCGACVFVQQTMTMRKLLFKTDWERIRQLSDNQYQLEKRRRDANRKLERKLERDEEEQRCVLDGSLFIVTGESSCYLLYQEEGGV